MNLIEKILKETKLGGERPAEAAGALLICPGTKRALINKRGPNCDCPNMWATFGGGVDETDPSLEFTVQRELAEEAGYNGKLSLIHIYTHTEPNFKFYNYIGFVPEEFKPSINDESSDYAWCTWQTLWEIEPKHPGFEEFLENAGDILEVFLTSKDTLVESLKKSPIENYIDFKNEAYTLADKYTYKGCRVVFAWNKHTHLCLLDRFSVPNDDREKGIGSSFMKEWCELADQYGITLALQPSGGLGGDIDRLKIFYSRFGFKDFENGYMKREVKNKSKLKESETPALNEFKSKIDALVDEFEDKGLSLIVTVSRHGAAELNSIKVKDPKAKNKGLGSAFMERFTDLCDQYKMIAILTASTEWGSSKTRLINFYKRFGFVNNTGKNKDYKFMAGMIRQPQ
jgi:8-oxo-dGTP pyrophosphatase MutT (NUDIX family)/N-acetylglutamate synthase-like GNAT family acetyltransferase